MPNLEWSVAMRFETPGGTVRLNEGDAGTGRKYIVESEGYKLVPSMRLTQDNISQQDGSVIHPRYKSGLVATMKITYGKLRSGNATGTEYAPACGADLRLMHEALVKAVNSIKRLNPTGVQRYFWQPTGYGDERMLDNIVVLGWPDPQYDLDGIEAFVNLAVESPFPYGIDSTEIQTTINTGAGVVANAGTSPQWPVIRVNGPATSFSITNANDVDDAGVAKVITYASTRPGAVAIGGGSYAEIDFFRSTIFLNGTGADLIAGLDPSVSDFWKLNTGNNTLTLAGAPSMLVKSNNAWA